MSVRLLVAIGVSLLTFSTIAETGTPLPAVKPGQYTIHGPDIGGSLIVRQRKEEVLFEIETGTRNGHNCSISGSLNGREGRADDLGEECRITFEPEPGAVKVKAITVSKCKTYCGAAATFDGLYKLPPSGCTEQNQKSRRNNFLKLYRAHDFTKASDELENLLEQCAAGFMGQLEIDKVRNDLALAQYHRGDSAACLRTLSATQAARYANEEQLSEELSPSDFDDYITIAKATWHNLSLCEKDAKAK